MGTVIRSLAGVLLPATLMVSCTAGSDPGAPPAVGGGDAIAGPAASPPAVPVAAADGKALYAANCAVCHGAEGRGDGPAAWLQWPRPRDFSRGLFQVRSTPSGQLPTDDDLLRTITNGMPGTAMPSWRRLGEAERKALVEQVKALSQFIDEDDGSVFNHFVKKAKPQAIEVPASPPVTPELIARGREVFLKQECVKCHGMEGHGDGPAADEQKDDWGNPIRPNDYARGLFNGGSEPRDIYLRIATGMTGTPMPQFGPELMSPEDRWALAHYVKSLARAPEGAKEPLPPGETIRASRRKGGLPRDPSDPAWDAVPEIDVPLQLLFQRASFAQRLGVRAAHDGSRIAFLLTWDDAAADAAMLRPQDFRDAVALQFALKGMETPYMMGSADKPVNLWHWKADWQKDIAAWQDVEQAHPGMMVEMYPFQKGDPTNDRGSRPASMPSHDPAFITARAAGNLAAEPRRRSAVEDLAAAGFGTLTSLPLDRQTVEGRGIWIGGRWIVQLSRELAPPDPCCVRFAAGKEVPVSFAVWDGGAGDRNGQKAVTTWYRLVLER